MTNDYVPAPGTAWRQQHISELDAAYELDRGRRRLSVPRNTAIDAAGKVREIVMMFLKAIERAARRSKKRGDLWEPSPDESKTLANCVASYEKAVATEERLRKMLKEEREGYSDEEHRIAMNRAIKMVAAEWPAKDWWDALRIGWGDEVARKLVLLKWGEQVLAELEGS